MSGGLSAPDPAARPGTVRRLLAAIADLLPVPPAQEPPDPLLAGLDELTPTERAARLRVSHGRFRRGRGDGSDGG